MTDPTTDGTTHAWMRSPSGSGRRERNRADPDTDVASVDVASGRPGPEESPMTAFLDAVAAQDARRADGTGEVAADPDAADPDDPDDPDGADADDDDLFGGAHGDRPKVANRLTRVLAVAIVVVAAFGGGVLLQKTHGSSSSAGGLNAAAFSAAGARPGGGFGANAPATGGTGAGAGGQAASVPAAVPVVVGTVVTVTATTLTVQNFAGATVTVTVPATATVTTPGLTPPSAGQTVSVTGTKQPDGSVLATAVTARAPG